MVNSSLYLIGVFVVGILSSLALGFYALMRETPSGTRTVKSLSFRIMLSLVLFVFLIIGWSQGWLHPHALGA